MSRSTPILGVVRRSGMVNVMVVVTRYFGGVKLGVRGLIEAYDLVQCLKDRCPVNTMATCGVASFTA